MAVELRLCDEDWERFGGPEWLVFDQDILDDLDSDRLDELERAMDLSIYELRKVEMARRTARAMKATAWLARQLSDDPELKTPGWPAFNIKPLKVRSRKAGGEGDPPADGPPGNKDGQAPAGSPESSSASTEDGESETPTPS